MEKGIITKIYYGFSSNPSFFIQGRTSCSKCFSLSTFPLIFIVYNFPIYKTIEN